MRIIIIGDGKVGTTLVSHLSSEGHNITVLDKNPDVIESLVNTYDVLGICGNGASYEILKEAGASHADLVISATSSDEINILSCLIARNLGTKSTIARVRNYDYNMQVDEMRKDLGLDMTINPELETARDILRIINFPEALRVDSFASGKVDLIELYLPTNSPLIGKSLASIRTDYKVNVLIGAISRHEEVYIPTGSFVFQEGDRIHIIGTKGGFKDLLKKLGLLEGRLKSVMIIGGGRISVYLAEQLIKAKYHVKIIEQSLETCKNLTALLPKAEIIYGDGTDQRVLDEEGIASTDAIICLTGIDEENIIISMYADKIGVEKIVAKVDKTSFKSIIESVGDVTVISPQSTTSNRIISYVRSNENTHGSNVIRLYKLINNQVEALEFKANSSSKLIGKKIKDIKKKDNILIASIIRDNEIITPSGMDEIKNNDLVIIITKNERLDDLDDILE